MHAEIILTSRGTSAVTEGTRSNLRAALAIPPVTTGHGSSLVLRVRQPGGGYRVLSWHGRTVGTEHVWQGNDLASIQAQTALTNDDKAA